MFIAKQKTLDLENHDLFIILEQKQYFSFSLLMNCGENKLLNDPLVTVVLIKY